eukprot:7096218-Lingulodinium_polyedra.AAC.1
MSPLAGVLPIPKTADAVADVAAVRDKQEAARHRPRGSHCSHELATLGRLRPLHGPGPRASPCAGDVYRPGRPGHERVLGVVAGP